ncbi:PaaI family thioesterase [Aquabacterium sp.]|uniref:PaaI family thioesterase n=1 Tax=Aquabacterium sp. TaxID=1872578 RepID=UPI002C4791F9|nr:PaaI family thioesterase [Aquabacterium sp.]HSW04158.1 PaaI family thioesterase [Aquabacterium sp.]
MTSLIPPDGYQPHTRRSPLTDPWEPLFARPVLGGVQLAVQVREAHCNSRGFAHGGLIAALADNAMGLSAVTTARQTRPEQSGAVTVGLTLDFIDSAQQGEWLEIHPQVLKCGGTLAFVECRVLCGPRIVARGSASFRLL